MERLNKEFQKSFDNKMKKECFKNEEYSDNNEYSSAYDSLIYSSDFGFEKDENNIKEELEKAKKLYIHKSKC